MTEQDLLATRFEDDRGHLRSVAYRLLGSLTEADDAVQEAWLRLSRSDVSAVENLTGWLTTVVARVSLDMLRSRKSRGLKSLDARVVEPVVTADEIGNPEYEAVLGDSVGLALLVVLDALAPAERLAFVLHDVFAMPFDEIAPIVDRTPAATRQLASRARRRVRGSEDAPAVVDRARQREVVNAFVAAARSGDFAALLDILDPDVVLRVDAGMPSPPRLTRGAQQVASRSSAGAVVASSVEPVLVSGQAGILSRGPDGEPVSVMGFTVRGGRVTEIYVFASAAFLAALDPPGRSSP